MTTRKTFSLPDDLARALERVAERESKAESAVVREALEPYLAARSASKLHLWVGVAGTGTPRDADETYDDILRGILGEKYERDVKRRSDEGRRR